MPLKERHMNVYVEHDLITDLVSLEGYQQHADRVQ